LLRDCCFVFFEDLYKDKDNKYAIVFRDAKAKGPFTLFGEEFTEKWTLNMVLLTTRAGWLSYRGESTAEFEGSYTIDIDYGFDRMAEATLKYQNDMSPGVENTLTSTGNSHAERTLAGRANAKVLFGGKGEVLCEIVPEQERDEKDVSVSGIVVHVLMESADGVTNFDLESSADAENRTWEQTNCWNDLIGSYQGISSTHPWEYYGDIYQRGDKAADEWKLTIYVR
jgi:hypothetical protein